MSVLEESESWRRKYSYEASLSNVIENVLLWLPFASGEDFSQAGREGENEN